MFHLYSSSFTLAEILLVDVYLLPDVERFYVVLAPLGYFSVSLAFKNDLVTRPAGFGLSDPGYSGSVENGLAEV